MALQTYLSSCIVYAPSSAKHASGSHGSFHLRLLIIVLIECCGCLFCCLFCCLFVFKSALSSGGARQVSISNLKCQSSFARSRIINYQFSNSTFSISPPRGGAGGGLPSSLLTVQRYGLFLNCAIGLKICSPFLPVFRGTFFFNLIFHILNTCPQGLRRKTTHSM